MDYKVALGDIIDLWENKTKFSIPWFITGLVYAILYTWETSIYYILPLVYFILWNFVWGFILTCHALAIVWVWWSIYHSRMYSHIWYILFYIYPYFYILIYNLTNWIIYDVELHQQYWDKSWETRDTIYWLSKVITCMILAYLFYVHIWIPYLLAPYMFYIDPIAKYIIGFISYYVLKPITGFIGIIDYYILKPITGSIDSYVLKPIKYLWYCIGYYISETILGIKSIIYWLWKLCWSYLLDTDSKKQNLIIALCFRYYNNTKLSVFSPNSNFLYDPKKNNRGQTKGIFINDWKNSSSIAILQKRKYSMYDLKNPVSVINLKIKDKLPSVSLETKNRKIKNVCIKGKLCLESIREHGKWNILEKLKSQEEKLDVNKLSRPRRYYPSATKEWYSSQYTYNTLEMRSILPLNITVTKLIKAYFTSIPKTKKLTRKKNKKHMTGRRILMTNKLYTSKPEIKHTSNIVTTTLYIFAGKRFNLTYLYRFLNKANYEDFLMPKLKENKLLETKKYRENNPNFDINFEFLKKNNFKIVKLYKLEKKFKTVRNLLENKLYEFYRKKQELRLIRLKYLYLSNDMLSEYIALKLISKKRNLFRAKRKIFRKIKLPYFNKHLKDHISLARKNIILKSLQYKTRTNRGKVIWNVWRKNKYFRPEIGWNIAKIKDSYKDFLNHIKYKFPVGIRLAIAGRLTKRNVASRSINKFTYIGRIKDIDSSYKNLSVSTLRGYIKANLDYTKYHSLAKTGAFTVKSWLSKNY